MKIALIVVLLLAVLVLLLARLRVGGVVRFGGGGLEVRVRAGWFYIPVYPARRAHRKKKEGAGKKREKASPQTGKEGKTLEQLRQYLPLLARAGGRLTHRIRIDKLMLSLKLAGQDDPAAAAVIYGGANAVLGMLLALLEQNFQVKDRRVHTEVDFHRKETDLELEASVSLRIGQLAGLAFYLLGELARQQREQPAAQSQKEAVEHGKQQKAPH